MLIGASFMLATTKADDGYGQVPVVWSQGPTHLTLPRSTQLPAPSQVLGLREWFPFVHIGGAQTVSAGEVGHGPVPSPRAARAHMGGARNAMPALAPRSART